MAEDVKDGLSAFCVMLAASLSDLAAAQQRGIDRAGDEFMAPLRVVFEALKV